MTVNELIEQLKKYPGDARILTPGFEGGYGDIDDMTAEDIVFNVNSKDDWYVGPHEYVSFMDNLPNESSQWRKQGLESGKCVIIR